jgi:hypothetical protein
MADGHAAYDPDRLPWLRDERKPRRSGDSTLVLLWALVAAMLVAGISYWAGVQSVTEPGEFTETATRSPPAATVKLPAPAAPQVPPPVLRELQPVAEPAPVRIPGVEHARPPKPKASRRVSAKPKVRPAPRKARARPVKAKAVPARKRAAARRPAQLQAWPASQSAGANGRLVRVGTFYSRQQAKQGWSRIMRVYPGMRRLRAVVVPSQSQRTGRTFYRLQFGTTSQAHSAVLCQRMRIVAQSCVVVGLPANRGVRG